MLHSISGILLLVIVTQQEEYVTQIKSEAKSHTLSSDENRKAFRESQFQIQGVETADRKIRFRRQYVQYPSVPQNFAPNIERRHLVSSPQQPLYNPAVNTNGNFPQYIQPNIPSTNYQVLNHPTLQQTKVVFPPQGQVLPTPSHNPPRAQLLPSKSSPRPPQQLQSLSSSPTPPSRPLHQNNLQSISQNPTSQPTLITPSPKTINRVDSEVEQQVYSQPTEEVKPDIARYYYPPRQRLPLPKCFHNPTGYVCCNKELNDLMVETYTEMEARPKFHTCNVQALATNLQSYAQQRFNTTFETIVGLEDFAQKVHFGGDLICKVELGGRYMLAYATVRDVEEYRLPSIGDKFQYGPVNYIPSHHISKRNTIRI